MADLAPHSIWHNAASPGRHGRTDGEAGVTILARRPLAMASLGARHRQTPALLAAAATAWGVALPLAPRRVESAGRAFLWMGPDRWLVTSEHDHDLAADLRIAVGDVAAITDQGDGRAVLRISGPGARAALGRLLPIDLHPRAFGPGDTALTQAGHIGVQLWQLDAAPTYELAMFRSLAPGLLGWLVEASAAFGTDLILEGESR
jgi:heterotetrameric sarcosine oxidase gamma subunit